MAGFQVHAESKYIPGSPIKARRVVNIVRGMYAQEALEILRLVALNQFANEHHTSE